METRFDIDDECNSIYKFQLLRYTGIRAENSNAAPVKRGRFNAFADRKAVYIYGTFSSRERCQEQDSWETQIWKFNLATRTWTKYKHITNVPFDIAFRTAALKNEVLMIYGSYYGLSLPELSFPSPSVFSNELYIYHLSSTDNFCNGPTLTTGEIPLPVFHQAVVCHGGYLYTVGGTTDNDFTQTCNIHRIHLETLVWEIVYVNEANGEYAPQNRCRYKIACDGVNIFMLGGIGEGGPIGFREISMFNIEKKQWAKRNTVGDSDVRCNDGYPPHAIFMAMCQSHHDVELKLHIYHQGCGEFWKINLKTFQWARICVLPVPLKQENSEIRSAFSEDGSKHYIIHSFSDSATTNPDIFVTWLEVPKLSDICWDAVLHSLKVFDKNKLLRAGVPLYYVNTI